MKLSETIKLLEVIKNVHGDVDFVIWDAITFKYFHTTKDNFDCTLIPDGRTFLSVGSNEWDKEIELPVLPSSFS